jgi:hypothetical protein
VWLDSQAFNGATAFNANIGAWNTARMTTMDYVCSLAIACVCGVCALAWDAALGVYAVGRGRSRLRSCMLACLLDSFLEEHMCTSENTDLKKSLPSRALAPWPA